MKKLPRKRRTREHVIADLSVNYVERHALVCGFVVERVAHDYGIDVELFTFNRNGEIDEGKVLLQVKASDQLRGSRGQQMFPFRIDRRDLVLWLAQPMPVILFAAGRSVTVQIPSGNMLTPSAMRRFAKFRDRVLEQMRRVVHDEG